MTESELLPLLEEALWSLRGIGIERDVENAVICLEAASALLGSTTTTVEKSGSGIQRKKKRKKEHRGVSLKLQGVLPDGMKEDRFRSAVIPLLEDYVTGTIVYNGFCRMNNGTYCYNFEGMCPCHKVVHRGTARVFQLKQHREQLWCGFKCWKQDSYIKVLSIPSLCY